jgi:hypothetical protein
MKHKHNWQFIERVGSHFINTSYSSDGKRKIGGGYWMTATLRFVCECGKTKLVLEK